VTGGILRPTSDVSRGQWVIDELGPWATFAGIVPPRFAAYARIFHPTGGQALSFDTGTARWSDPVRLRWSEVAAREGTVMHPLAQWDSLLGHYVRPLGDRAGFQYDEPALGALDVDSLAAVAAVLAAHTSTPDDCLAALWEGHGEVWGGVATVAFVAVGESESDVAARVEPEPAVPPFLDAAAGARLHLPERDSLLFELDVRTLAEPGWGERSGWASRSRTLTPQCLWPEDRAWFLASEIDFDSTLVGGSEKLIADLLALDGAGAIEILRLPAGVDLSSTGDFVDPPPSRS
jgi:hypothetical protein